MFKYIIQFYKADKYSLGITTTQTGYKKSFIETNNHVEKIIFTHIEDGWRPTKLIIEYKD